MIGARPTLPIVASLYNDEYVGALLEATRTELARILPEANIPVFRVPGAFEIPVCAAHLARNANPSAVIALGVIIRGQTQHADLVAQSVFESLQNIATAELVPVINEVLLVDSAEQAAERCTGANISRGVEAARAAAGIIETLQNLKSTFPVPGTHG